MKFIYYFLILTITVYVSTSNIRKRDTSEIFYQKSFDFAFKLYSEIGKSKEAENIIIAPFSVQTALGLVYIGTSGETSEQFVKGIKLVSNEKSTVANSFRDVINSYSSSPILHIANKIFVSNQYEIKPEFQDIAKNSFFSEVENVDFSQKTKAASAINEWVDAKTNHKIKDIVAADAIDDSTKIMLVNAVHFKADWDKQFVSQKTEKQVFHHSSDKDVLVDMMTFNYEDKLFDPNFTYGHDRRIGFKALDLTFKNSNFSILFILPQEGKSLADVERDIHKSNFFNLISRIWKTPVEVKIPKFKIEFKQQLNQNLCNIGMKNIFDDTAQLTEIFKVDHHLKISAVIHKSVMEIDERGTEASAATAIPSYILGGKPDIPSENFYANRPFIFIIKDKAAVHFIGHYTASEYF